MDDVSPSRSQNILYMSPVEPCFNFCFSGKKSNSVYNTEQRAGIEQAEVSMEMWGGRNALFPLEIRYRNLFLESWMLCCRFLQAWHMQHSTIIQQHLQYTWSILQIHCPPSPLFQAYSIFPENSFQHIQLPLLHFLTKETIEKKATFVHKLCAKSGKTVWRWKRGIRAASPSFTRGHTGPQQRWGGTFPQRQHRLPPALFLFSTALIVSFTGKDGSVYLCCFHWVHSLAMQMLK